jgi:exopolyphosphatase/pppGpp-phosphohydrolase
MSRPGTESQTASTLSHLKSWVFSHLGTIHHEKRVSAIVRSLFEVTLPLHDLTFSELRLLKLAAYVHDVGRVENDEDHPAIGARMIRRAKDLPLKKRHRRLLSYMTLRHRGRVPDLQDDPALGRVNDPARAQLLLAFLRAADALDSRSLPSPHLTFSRRGSRVRIVCRLREDSAKARRIFSRRKKFRLLEELLDCQIEVAVIGRSLRAAA